MSDRPTSDLTRILRSVTERGRDAVQLLLPAVYEELRVVAGQYLQSERPGITLSATALVHEAYVKLIEQQGVSWKNRAHFLAVAA